LEWADILVIGAPHDQFKDLKTTKPIVDIWNLFATGELITSKRGSN
jgi:UDP-N-acetyl-D-mannosaminuronic acid dehydrogenase